MRGGHPPKSAMSGAERPMSAPAGHPMLETSQSLQALPRQYHDDEAVSRQHQDDEASSRLTVHEANRVRKAVESNVKSIENRIRFFQREEEKIWRDLEGVRRQAATIEEGRTRTLEKKKADMTICHTKQVTEQQNKSNAAAVRVQGAEQRRRNQSSVQLEKQRIGDDQRRISQDILRQKRMNEAQVRLQNSERAVAMQRSQLEAKLKANQEKAMKIDNMRERQEADRMQAELEVQEVENRLPALEAEEMVCLQRLQNSRILTQSVLEELDNSLGSHSSVTALLRSKTKQQDHLEGVREDDMMRYQAQSPMALAPAGM